MDMSKPDPRLHAYRDDLADIRLKETVSAPRYVEGRRMQVVEPFMSVHRHPRPDAMQLTQALLGETLLCFDEQEGWAFVQLEADGYVGYVPDNGLSAAITIPTHRVAVPSTLRYTRPDLKSQPVSFLPFNAAVAVTGHAGPYARLDDGRFVWAAHLRPVGQLEEDHAAIASLFLHAPYYWGGRTVQGLDCSGLIQLALQACGMAAPRDSDMQERSLGSPLPPDRRDELRRGDLVFWRGHVGVMLDAEMLLHANGHHMQVVAEPLAEARARIAASHGPVTSIRRLQ